MRASFTGVSPRASPNWPGPACRSSTSTTASTTRTPARSESWGLVSSGQLEMQQPDGMKLLFGELGLADGGFFEVFPLQFNQDQLVFTGAQVDAQLDVLAGKQHGASFYS